ncbi:unnamed protein product, partial [Polarella glacialis]
DILFLDETLAQDPSAWCRLAAPSLERCVPFPNAVLRLSSELSVELRTELLDAGLVQVPYFSKALTGMLLVHEDKVRPLVPLLNEFLLTAKSRLQSERSTAEPDTGQLRPEATERVPVSESRSGREVPEVSAAVTVAGTSTTTCACIQRRWASVCSVIARATEHARSSEDEELHVDCKSPMANERTVLRWLRSAIILCSLSAFLSSQEDVSDQINGLLLAVVSILF